MPRRKELAEALEIIEDPVETETRCSKCRFRNNTTLWSCAYIDIVGVSKRLAFPHALPQELCETEGHPCIAFQEGERQDSPFRSISRLSKEQGRRSRQAQEKEFLRLYEGGIADRSPRSPGSNIRRSSAGAGKKACREIPSMAAPRNDNLTETAEEYTSAVPPAAFCVSETVGGAGCFAHARLPRCFSPVEAEPVRTGSAYLVCGSS